MLTYLGTDQKIPKKKNILHKPIEKKIKQELGMIFKIVMQMF
jgi:hypothetical protein